MKKKILHIILFFSASIVAQDQKEMLLKGLNESIDTLGVIKAKEALKDKYRVYKAYFNFVPSINPLNPKKQKRVSSKFGKRFHPIDKKVKAHLGLDISAKVGTPIHACASGTVEKTIHSNKGYGNQVIIKHMYGYKTVYAHMYLFSVKKGMRVKKGDIIGFVGNTGKSTGPHLHYEIRKFNKPIDPYPFCFLSL